jgi:hypothetical protein
MKHLISLFAAVFVLAAVSTAHAQATIYNQPANPIAQLVGGPGATPNLPTYAATMTISPVNNAVTQIAGNATTSSTSTVTAGSVGNFGQLWIIIVSDTGGITVTFSTGFKPTATVNPTTGKSITVAFVSDGTVWREFARSASAQ